MSEIIESDVIIIGGGPGGSSCAWRLKEKYGIESIVLEKSDMPRLKLCAGWITEDVKQQLEIDPETYPHRFVTFNKIHGEYFGSGKSRKMEIDTTQYSISRTEFDAWLLNRSGARVIKHTVANIKPDGEGFLIDDKYRCKYLIGAGGTFCPVFRILFKDRNPRSKEFQIGALEQEFEYDYKDEECRLWFGENGLVGYSWYVPKGDGVINVGIGGWSEYISEGEVSLRDHWDLFTHKLAAEGLVTNFKYKPKGHTYYLRERAKVVRIDNAFIIGDSAGLATRDLAEGIGPAMESGLRAADTIATGKEYNLKGMTKYSMFHRGLMTEFMYNIFDRKGRFYSDRIYARGRRAKEKRALELKEKLAAEKSGAKAGVA